MASILDRLLGYSFEVRIRYATCHANLSVTCVIFIIVLRLSSAITAISRAILPWTRRV